MAGDVGREFRRRPGGRGVDIALHDLRGKALKQSVAEMYGGRVRDKVLAYAAAMNYTEGVRPEDQFPAEAARWSSADFWR